MRDEHITGMLDDAPFAALDASELATMRAHVEGCAGCARAFEAARVSSLLLRARAAETVEPSPFFQTRVLAALRERQAANEAWSLRRMWKSAGLLVSTMAATVAALAALTFIAPQAATTTTEVASADNSYSAEAVIFDEGEPNGDEPMTYGQVLTTLYESEDAAAR
jgi:anti-sigma-K factor RskA